MVRRIVALLVALAPLLPLPAQSRYVSDTAGAPVKWEGWSTRALERSRNEKRPIFLSIGYASSYPSFMMQREAFLNGEVAETLNAYYVPTLLDRLEYPEVAQAYESIARSMNVSTESPVLMILTPSLEPFAVSGYLGTADLSRALVINANRWANERDKVIAEAHQIVLKARASVAPPPPAASPQADELKKLALTATRDQLGGGFHRPTGFEKMLDDQAFYAIAYLEAWQKTRDPELEQLARSTLDAALRDLRPPKGAFDASQDAHSLVPAQGPEFWNGAFYVWEKDEIARLLGQEGALKIFRLYDMKAGERNVLAVKDAVALKDPALPPLLAKMLDLRQKRPQPFRESNTISGLNGLMISAMARAGAVLGERTYIDAATIAALTVTKNLWNAQKKALLHSAGVAANATDYAMLTQGLLDLFEASYDPRWLDLAVALQQKQDQLFWDERSARYTTGASVPEIVRGLETPFDRTISDRNMFRLAMLTGDAAWRSRSAHIALNGTPKVSVVVGDPRKKVTFDTLHAIHERWEPLRFVLFVPGKGVARDRMTRAIPFTAALVADPENPVTYECMNGQCVRR